MVIPSHESGFVDATLRSLDVLDALHEDGPATVTELAASLPYSKSTVHRHLRTLEAAEYVVEGHDGFRISLLYLDYGLAARESSPLYRAVSPKLREIADETGEKVWAMTEEHGRGVFFDGAAGKRSVETYARIGERTHLHHFAGGKAILAFMDRSRVVEIIDRRGLPGRTDESITVERTLFRTLERVRERGAAFNRSESIVGINAVGVPVLDTDGRPLCAISVAGPANRLHDDYLQSELASLLQGVANEIEIQLTVEGDDGAD